MRISIITATYNSAATVADTLKSVAEQTYPQVEHLIVDGLSKDDTLRIVEQFPHVARVNSEKDKGIYDAMNKGIALSSGEIVGILNSDDFYVSKDVLQWVADAFADPAIDAVYGNLQYVDPVDTNKVLRHWRAGAFHRNKFYQGWMPPHPGFFVRKRLYNEFGVFNTALRSAADYEIMLRFLFKHEAQAAYVDKLLVKMRSGGMSNASLRNRLRANSEDRQAWRLNGLKPRFYTLTLKPLRKINQYFIK